MLLFFFFFFFFSSSSFFFFFFSGRLKYELIRFFFHLVFNFLCKFGIRGACAVCNYDLLHAFPDYHAYNTKGRLQNPTAGWPAVLSGSGRLSLFRTIKTGRNRTETPVNRRLGFEAVPNTQFAIRGQLEKSDRATKLIVILIFNDGFERRKIAIEAVYTLFWDTIFFVSN